MNSCLYECNVMHCRVEPKHYKFNHKVFMFYLDLDEIGTFDRDIKFFGYNRHKIFEFRDKDHLEFGAKSVKQNLLEFLKQQGLQKDVGRVMLLTNVRVFGYIFNPVSFYYCFDKKGEPLCVVPEIRNTFHELKPFYMGPESFNGKQFESQQKKYFYISPFVDLDVPMDFQLKVPDERLDIRIDDLREERKFFYSSLTGKKTDLNNRELFWKGVKYPFVTLKVIGLIHYHAAVLHYIKRIPHHKKNDNRHLQKEVQREYFNSEV